MMAAATIIVAPLVVAFLLAQRRFIEGITLTGMK
jgi:multiple sugar transport system permease protein